MAENQNTDVLPGFDFGVPPENGSYAAQDRRSDGPRDASAIGDFAGHDLFRRSASQEQGGAKGSVAGGTRFARSWRLVEWQEPFGREQTKPFRFRRALL